MGIYPEGTRSLDGRLYRGKTGVARMALEAGVPVIPVAMVGTDKVQPIGRRIPHVGRVGIVIGEPLDFSRYEGMAEDRYVLRSVTDEIMYALMELSGQEYVDIYASTMKERLAAAKRKTNAVSERVERVAERGRSAADQAGSLTGSHDGAAHEAAREAAREAAGGTADEESPDVDATG